jgi:hypothetical protein
MTRRLFKFFLYGGQPDCSLGVLGVGLKRLSVAPLCFQVFAAVFLAFGPFKPGVRAVEGIRDRRQGRLAPAARITIF